MRGKLYEMVLTEHEMRQHLKAMCNKWSKAGDGQAALAARLNLSPQYMSQLLAGTRPITRNIADRLGYDVVVKVEKTREFVERN